ncbi:MAG: metal transporter [Bacteroidetes bacterium]|nr:metal transporter [Bacteroidota bacterium]
MNEPINNSGETRSSLLKVGQLILPLVLLTAVLVLFIQLDPMESLTGNQPPVEDLSVERVILNSEGIVMHVINAGPETVTIAQVLVDEAYWSFNISPANELPRLGRATITIPYHWVEGEAHELRLLTSSGATFDHTIDVAVATPPSDVTRWFLLGLVGFFVGIVPVGLGLMWFPLLQSMKKRALDFVLALTVGLLVFLLFDTILEGVEFAGEVPEVFNGLPLVFLIAFLSYMMLTLVGRRQGVRDRSTPKGRLWIATAISIGIGLHNLGEGMVVGVSIASGEAALGSFLVIGFVLHNVTEGVGIGAPMAVDRPGFGKLIALTVIAGGPAIIGTWIGGFSYTPFLAVLFFAVGAGAILQVIVEVSRLLGTGDEKSNWLSWSNMMGMMTGITIMYVTALLV